MFNIPKISESTNTLQGNVPRFAKYEDFGRIWECGGSQIIKKRARTRLEPWYMLCYGVSRTQRHVKRTTNSTVKRSTAARVGDEQVSMRAAGSETGRQRASRTTSANQVYATTVLGDARAVSSDVMVPTPTDPMVFHNSTRDVKTRSAVKENTNETRDGGGSPGVRRPGDGLSLRSNN